MIVRAAGSAVVLLGAIACAGFVLGAPEPGAAAPRDGCSDALTHERAAADDSRPRQGAYDSAVAGLSVNQTCANPQQRLVNEAYLLSIRAAAAHDLNVGDWRRDLARANVLLEQCAATRGLAGMRTAENCRSQLQFNRAYEASLAAPSPSPAPAPAGPASPTPRPPG